MEGSPSVRKLLESKGRAVVTIAGSRSVRDCAAAMSGKGVGSLLVLNEDGGLAGIMTWHDVLACVATRSDELASLQAADVMSTNARSTTEDADLKAVESMMVKENVRHLPVLADSKVVGVITRIDVLRRHLDEADAMTDQLERYITGQYP